MILNKQNVILSLAICIWGLIIIFCILYIFNFYTPNLPILLKILILISTILYFINRIFTIFILTKLKIAHINLEQLSLHNKTLESIHEKTSAFRHDIPNILQGMAGYINSNDIIGLKTYYSQFVDDIHNVSNLSALNPNVINSPAVYNILANKYYKCDNLNIKINLEIFFDFKTLNMKTYEFCRILGILIDNAIEAADECEEKTINITIRKDNYRNIQLLIIENTYKNKDINIDEIYKKGFSTKSNNTGIGLWEVRQILKKNNNLNLYTTKNDKYFSQQLEIYINH